MLVPWLVHGSQTKVFLSKSVVLSARMCRIVLSRSCRVVLVSCVAGSLPRERLFNISTSILRWNYELGSDNTFLPHMRAHAMHPASWRLCGPWDSSVTCTLMYMYPSRVVRSVSSVLNT